MSRFQVGSAIRHHADAHSDDIGVVIWVDECEDRLWYVPFPREQKLKVLKEGAGKSQVGTPKPEPVKVRSRHYISAPCYLPLSAVEQDEAYTAPTRKLPPLLVLTDEQLEKNEMCHMHFKTRRDLGKSVAIRDRQWAWIEDLVNQPMPDLLDPDSLLTRVQEVQRKFQLNSYAPVIRALRCYWLWGRAKNSLLARYDKCNEIGAPKFTTKRPGRPSKYRPKDQQGIVCTRGVREILRNAWTKYVVKQKLTAEHAYSLMLKDHYWKSGSRELQDVHMLPTESQFRSHGPANDPARASSRVKQGENDYNRNSRPLLGTAQDGLVAFGIMCQLDASPEDQNLVATKSRLQPMATCYSTKVVEGYSGYILGVHIGYERPSQMTALLAVANAASPKQAYARRRGVELETDEWLNFGFSRVLGDNGDIKGEAGFKALSTAEVSAEFCASLAAERKGFVESAHKSTARKAAHVMVGSTKGRRLKRGEPDPAKGAAIQFHEHVKQTINAICYLNNKQRVPHLLTDEMRADKVRPFRRDILLWMAKKGYVKTEAPNFDVLRANCLPRLKCTVFRHGVCVEDPTSKTKRYVPKLIYTSKALMDTGALDIGQKGFPGTILLDPDAPREAWVEIRDHGLIRVELKNPDPLIDEKTFADFVRQAFDDREFAAADKHRELSDQVKVYAAADEANQAAVAAKQQEAAAQAAQSTTAAAPSAKGTVKTSSIESKRTATANEVADQLMERLGVGDLTSKETSNVPEACEPAGESGQSKQATQGERPRRPTDLNWAKKGLKQILAGYDKH